MPNPPNPANAAVEPVTDSAILGIDKLASPQATPPSGPQILDAVLADAPGMAALGAKVFTESFGYSIPPDDLATFLATTYSTKAFEAEMRNPQISTWAAKDAPGTLLGFVQLVRGITDDCLGSADPAGLAHLHRLYIDSSMHGGGLGTRLIAAAETAARVDGFRQVWLTVWVENLRAQRLYERLGYAKVGTTSFVMGSCVQMDWVMVKQLGK